MKFSKAQSDNYFELCKYRINNVYLTWVEQFLDIIEQNINTNTKLSINDIGCNLGQFYKGLKRRDFRKNIKYNGFDNSEKYLAEAKKTFPEIKKNFKYHDISEKTPPNCNISVASATFEHIPNYIDALNNTFKKTKDLFLLRTFLSENYDKQNVKIKDGNSYPVQQFSYYDICSIAKENDFSTEMIRDKFTDSLPMPVGSRTGENIIIRTFYICKFIPNK